MSGPAAAFVAVIDWVAFAGILLIFVHVFTAGHNGGHAEKLRVGALSLFNEIRNVWYVVYPLDAVFDFPDIGNPFLQAIYAICVPYNLWYAYKRMKDDDNDRWKRRRKKAAARVKQVAGKLVVVPEPVAIPVKG